MPIIGNELGVNSKGGTEQMVSRLSQHLTSSDPSLLEAVDIFPSRVRQFDATNGRKKVLWLHDLPNDPESSHLASDGGERFDSLIFVSNWQQQAYFNTFNISSKPLTRVIPNGIPPLEINWNKWDLADKQKPIRLVYHTTPHRGLELLYWWLQNRKKALEAKIQRKIEVDIFSSFAIYGWHQRDAQYEHIFNGLREIDGVNYHGSVSNETVREHLSQVAHIFAYPSIWPETFCIAGVEALSGGVLTVTSNLAALPETLGPSNFMYCYTSDAVQHIKNFTIHLESMIRAIDDDGGQQQVPYVVEMEKKRVDLYYNWDYVSAQWSETLRTLLGV